MKRLYKIYQCLRADTAGVVAVEAAIITPFLAVIGLAAIDASYMFLQNHKMEQALVSAANYMSLSDDPSTIEAHAKRIAISGTTNPTASPIINNWSVDDVIISYKIVPNNGDYRGGDFVRVVDIQSSHPYNGFGLIKAISGNSITLNAQYQQRMTRTVK